MKTDSGSVKQCLIHWKEPGKIFPERYAWGGRLGKPIGSPGDGYGTQSVGKYEMWGGGDDGLEERKHIIPSPDVCAGKDEPICGVCDYGGMSPGENIVKGMEAAWTFVHLELDLYLMLNGADGNGFRCLGFQTPDAPYPALLTWHFTTVVEEFGKCMTVEFEGLANETEAVAMHEGEEIKCKEDIECTGRDGQDTCKRMGKEAGEWRTDGEVVYFCGFETNEAGTAREKLMANGGTVWNVY